MEEIKDPFLEIETLQAQLKEAQETLRAIREGEVDALVVSSPQGEKVFTLKGSEQLPRIILQEMGEGVVTLVRGNIVYCNRHFSLMTESQPENIIGRSIKEFISREDHHRFQESLDKASFESSQGEFTVTNAKGQKLQAYISFNAFESDSLSAHCLIIRDLTELKKVRNEMFKIKGDLHLANIVEYSSDAIISKNLNSVITSWNKGAERIFGYKAQEVIGKSILLLMPEERHSEEQEIIKKIQHGELIEHYETIRRCKDGKLIHASLTVSPIIDPQGKVIGASQIARDISEQKKTQESLAKINQELEKRVQERTSLLQEQSERLRDFAVELISAEENERKRLAQILHDHLQQLLVAAKMKIDLIQRKEIHLIDKEAHNVLRNFIDEAFESARSLTAELRPPVLYESGLIPALRFLVRKFYDQYQFKVETSLDSDAEPASHLLRTMIYSTIQEIIFNAVKYAKVNECSLEIKRLPDGNIRIIIRDKGQGFKTEGIDKKGSAGFGLFSIRERMKALGGEFKIESFIGQGTSFEINIPDRHTVKEEVQSLRKIDPVIKDFKKKKNGGLSILLVDDHKILRQSLANLLLTQPFIDEISEAEDGIDALEKARSINPDVIIMDLNIPRLNGIEATRVIHQSHPDIKIVGLSIQTEPETMQAMKDSGAIAYFHKGEETDVLIEALKDFSKPSLSH